MLWSVTDPLDERPMLVRDALSDRLTIAEACGHCGSSWPTGHNWIRKLPPMGYGGAFDFGLD